MPYRNGNGGMIFICDDIPRRLLTKYVFSDGIDSLFTELSLIKVKGLLFATYQPLSQRGLYYFSNLDKALDWYSHYDKKLLFGDFNTEV